MKVRGGAGAGSFPGCAGQVISPQSRRCRECRPHLLPIAIVGTDNSDLMLTIPFVAVNEGQEVIIEYNLATIGADADFTVGADSAFSVTTTVQGGSERLILLLQVNVAVAVTKITGGVVTAPAGSGRAEIKPASINAGIKNRSYTVTYTAYTTLTDTTIKIDTDGLITVDPNPNDTVDVKLQTEFPNKYGYVSGSVSSSASTLGSDKPTISGGNAITWTDVNLVALDKLTTTISRVDVTDVPNNYVWGIMVGEKPLLDDKNTTEDDRAILSITKTDPEAVKLSVDGDDSFPAASKQTIKFKFTAVDTPIRDGSVWFSIPSALGSGPAASDADAKTAGKVSAGVTSGKLDGTKQTEWLTVSGRTVTVKVKSLDVGGTVTVTYGTDGTAKSLLHNVAAEVKVIGNYRTTAGTRSAGTTTVTLTNVMDGHAKEVEISPQQAEAGSSHSQINVTFTAIGTMDGGQVSLELPTSGRWGLMQVDPSQPNYVQISGNSNVVLGEPVAGTPSNKAVAKITKLAAGQSFTFSYGGGSGGVNNGAQVQDNTGVATFIIRSDGGGDGVFAAVFTVASETEQTATEKIVNPEKLGAIFKGALGLLNVDVIAAADGTGKVVVAPLMVRAGDLATLTFTYTSTQTIQGGELRFTVSSVWSPPQVSDAGLEGYTVVSGLGLGTAVVPEGRRYVTVPIISIAKDEKITITYGATDDGKAKAPTAVNPSSVFTFAVRGTPALDGGALKGITSGSPAVKVEPQASGKAMSATATISDGQGVLYAGQDDRQITVVYTAAAQMVQAEVQLTIPAKATRIEGLGWSAPMADNVTVSPTSAYNSVEYGGSLAIPAQTVIVDGVNLLGGGTITFVYTGKVQPLAGDATFAVATKGGLETDTAFVAVVGPMPEDVMVTLPVGEAKTGSGDAEIADSDSVVAPGAPGETITFTYTAAGEISYPREFRVRVPAGWSAPTANPTSPENAGTYSVGHLRDSVDMGNRIVEEIAPVDRDMVARVKTGVLHVLAGDQIVITYENATAPATAEVSPFRVFFGGQTNDAQVEQH